MRRAPFLLLCVAGVSLAGCYESFELPSELLPDGAVRDAGIIVSLPDAGRRDAGRRNDAGTRDSGVGPCAASEIIPPYAGPRCAASTRACIEECDADPASPPDCTDLCFADDFACVECINHTLIACANELGCQAAWDAFACCADRECPGGGAGIERLNCAADGSCGPELDAYSECVGSRDLAICDAEIQGCF